MLRNNLMQMSDQRVARISHVMLRTDPAALAQRTKGECNELLTQWKAVIGHPRRYCVRRRVEKANLVLQQKGRPWRTDAVSLESLRFSAGTSVAWEAAQAALRSLRTYRSA